MGGTNRKCAVALLPVKVGKLWILCFDPFGGISLEVADQICDIDSLAQSAEKVHVVLGASDDQRGRVKILADTRQVAVGALAKRLVLEKRSPVFGGKDEVDVDLDKRLRHAL